MQMLRLSLVVLAVVAIWAGSSFAQDNSTPPTQPNIAAPQARPAFVSGPASEFDILKRKRFIELNIIDKLKKEKEAYEQARSSSLDQQQQFEAQLRDLKPPLSIQELDANIDRVGKEKDRLQKDLISAKNSPSSDAKYIDEITKNIMAINRYANELETQKLYAGKISDIYNTNKQRLEGESAKANNDVKRFDDEITTRQNDIERDTQTLQDIENDIANLLITADKSQTFKMWMSGAFAALIAMVIVGFFTIALRDGKVRDAIFSHDSGIQFITLFALVIAIILFGITGILEGKELAALLGGLSGYILGRGGAAMRSVTASSVETPQAAREALSPATETRT